MGRWDGCGRRGRVDCSSGWAGTSVEVGIGFVWRGGCGLDRIGRIDCWMGGGSSSCVFGFVLVFGGNCFGGGVLGVLGGWSCFVDELGCSLVGLWGRGCSLGGGGGGLSGGLV